MSECLVFTIEPFDTMVFRDGRPFQQDDQGLAEIVEVFPPPPPAVAGAVKVAVFESLGVKLDRERNKPGAWKTFAEGSPSADPPEVAEQRKAVGKILDATVVGPFVAASTPTGDDALGKLFLPAPFALHFPENPDNGRNPIAFMNPRAGSGKANLGMAGGRTLAPGRVGANGQGQRTVPASEHWLPWRDLLEVIRKQQVPDLQGSCRPLAELRSKETRIGIAITKATGRVKDGQLYAATHQRFLRDFGHRPVLVALTAVDAFDPLPKNLDRIVPFGGEGRFARVRCHGALAAPRVSAHRWEQAAGFVITAITPVPLAANRPFGLNLGLVAAFQGFECVAATHERPVSVGFADQAATQRGHSRIISVFPVGSTWFLQPNRQANAIETARPKLSGPIAATLAAPDLAQLGYGAVVMGFWW